MDKIRQECLFLAKPVNEQIKMHHHIDAKTGCLVTGNSLMIGYAEWHPRKARAEVHHFVKLMIA